MNFKFTLILTFLTTFLSAQNFETYNLPIDTFLNDGGDDGYFLENDILLNNNFYETYWDGWAISTMTDTQTPGYLNQYSSITGGGADGSQTYAVSFAFSPSQVYLNDLDGYAFQSISVNNSTYAYLSMQDGDTAAKKFGGETGDDPDFFLLTIKGYHNGVYQDSFDFYLADFRFEDNGEDYILENWTTIDIATVMQADSLTFVLSSSDTGMWGMNTPAYFCMDNIEIDLINAVVEVDLEGVVLKNNLTNTSLQVVSDWNGLDYQIVDNQGQLIRRGQFVQGDNQVDVQALPVGTYHIFSEKLGKIWLAPFIKF